jgi:hypothetical protein
VSVRGSGKVKIGVSNSRSKCQPHLSPSPRPSKVPKNRKNNLLVWKIFNLMKSSGIFQYENYVEKVMDVDVDIKIV